MRRNNIVVTGGCGFIGSHVIDSLMQYPGTIPYIIDDLSRGKNIPSCESGFFLVLEDLESTIPDFSRMNVVFHMAAKVASIRYNMNHHFEMMQSNLDINSNVAKAIYASRNAIERVMWVSTICVASRNVPVPTPEDGVADTCDPEPTNRGYGIAKWVGEQQAKYLWREYHIPVTIVRFFNAFGPRDYYDEETSHVAPAIIKKVLDGNNPIEVWGTGTQTRVLVDARDLAKALLMLAECEAAYGQVVNIGHDDEISMYDLAEMIADLAHMYGYIDILPRIVCRPDLPNGHERRAADTTKLRNLIGWVPNTPIENTLLDMIRDYDARRCKCCNYHPCICKVGSIA